MRALLVVLLLIVAVFLVIFGAQNTAPVNVRFLNFNTGFVSLSLLIIVSAVVGAVLTALIGLLSGIRRSLSARATNKRLHELEKENADLNRRVITLQSENTALRNGMASNPAAAAPPAVSPAAPSRDPNAEARPGGTGR
jgi:uncharacterized integral membrane protein